MYFAAVEGSHLVDEVSSFQDKSGEGIETKPGWDTRLEKGNLAPRASHRDSYIFRHENWAIVLATLIRQRNEICKSFLKVDSQQHSHQAKS